MSGGSYRDREADARIYETYVKAETTRTRGTSASERAAADAEVQRLEAERAERLKERRRKIADGEAAAPRFTAPAESVDRRLAQNTFTVPPPEADEVVLFVTDNSGSNRLIAEHQRTSCGYLLAQAGVIAPRTAIGMIFGSDHSDGRSYRQDVNWVLPNERDARVFGAGISNVYPAHGDDEAEAFECLLHEACDVPFGNVTHKRLILTTDVVAHGMGLKSDRGCSKGRRYEDTLRRVYATFDSFEVIGVAQYGDHDTYNLQKKLVDPDRVGTDYLSFHEIKNEQHRLGIVGNAQLFLIARHHGYQTVRMFLMALYEKWLREPIFGQQSDITARAAIERFLKFLTISEDELRDMRKAIFTA